MRRLMFVVLSAAAAAVAVPLAAQTAPQARPAAPVATSEPTPAAPVAMPASAFPQDVTPPAPPQRGGRGAAQGIPGQTGGRGGRGSANGTAAPASMGRGTYAYAGTATMENIKVDVVLSDSITQSGGKKTVSMVVTNGRKGQIRSSGNGGYTLNVDAQPQLLSDGRILVALELMYLPETTSEAKQVAMINESLSVLVTNGTSMLVSQSADPRSDRKVTVELTASTQK